MIGLFNLSRTGLTWRANFMATSAILSLGILGSCSSLCHSILTLLLSKQVFFRYIWHSSGPAGINALVSSKQLASHYRAKNWD